MCGIVGYLGPQSPKDVILSGLKKLEYRGYDSAGIAIFDKGQFRRVRAEGKLGVLQKKLEGDHFDGHIGIGHTRWATHGVPSEANAHPHQVGDVILVHNGIIENYMEIREELAARGTRFSSETDTELVAHLLSMEIEKTQELLKAVQNVLQKLTGAYSILAVWQKAPEQMVAFKSGPPLVVGCSDKEVIVASDLQPIVEHTKNVAYLEDGEILYVNGLKVEFWSSEGKKIKKEFHTVDWTTETAEKKGFPHFMLKEIFEQPRAVANAIEPHVDLQTFQVNLKDVRFEDSDFCKKQTWKTDQPLREYLARVDRVQIIACGTSFYAGLIGEYLIERFAHLPVEVDIASEFRYRKPILTPNQLVIVISQSGETADTLAALRLAKEQGAAVFAICNVKNSSIDRESHGHLAMRSDVEIGVASTKAFTSTLAILNVLALYLGKVRGKISGEEEKKHVRLLLDLPSQMEKVLVHDKFFSEAAETLKQYKGFLYIGRLTNYPIALEGALKLKELAYMHAEGYAAGEMKHGPIALIDSAMAVVVVAPSDDVYEKTLSNLEEVRARGGQIISIGTSENDKLMSLSRHYLSIPVAPWNLNAILSVIPLQLMAYHVAAALGYDVDQPRNLAKSVTVE